MSDEMAVNDTATGEESNANCDNAEVVGPEETIEAIAEAANRPTTEHTEELNIMEAESQDPEVQLEIKPEVEPDSKAEDKPENRTEIKAIIESELKSESILEAQPDLKMEVDAQPETGAETNIPDEPKGEKLCIETHDLAPEEMKLKISGDQTPQVQDTDEMCGIKQQESETFSDQNDEEFIGFEKADPNDSTLEYSRVLERMEAEVQAASESFTRVRSVTATPPAVRAVKRPRQDTGMSAHSHRVRSRYGKRDGSRPSSGLSSRSDDDGMSGADGTSGAGAGAGGGAGGGGRARRPATAQLLVPLERGWKRELVHRATLDSHLRRNADIYYYTPAGKKLRSMREISEHLSGTGLTMDNFSFFKEPLGLDDPEKEIIRDAKMQRRVESPVSSPAPAPAPPLAEGKRVPKPKRASPEPAAPAPAPAPAAPKSPPTKIKVKSVGSRLAGNGAASAKKKGAAAPGASADNNNSAAWKKPRQPPPGAPTLPPGAPASPPPPPAPAQPPPHPPPPLQSRPPAPLPSPEIQSRRQVLQPCSMACGRGAGAVPSLSCAACLCLYHPACAGLRDAPAGDFFCKNCRKPSPPPLEPPPLTHKSGVTTASSAPGPAPKPVPVPIPVPVPVPVPRRIPGPVPASATTPKGRSDKRVLLRMKVSGGGPHGQRVWAVTQPPAGAAPAPAPPRRTPSPSPTPTAAPAPTPGPAPAPVAASTPVPGRVRGAPPPLRGPQPPRSPQLQSLGSINGRRFIIVRRPIVHDATKHENRRGRIANGASPPPAAAPSPAAPSLLSPRRRARPRPDDTDYFTPFYNTAQERSYNVALQIFPYLGMRDLARAAQVCRQWRQIAAAPALWRHVRMKNSHVSDWGGLCAALKRHGTARLDLRKMLLPQSDAAFWEQFAAHIHTVDTLERIEMCRCPAMAVEAVCRVRGLRALSALAIRDALLDPAPLALLPRLHELRLKSMAGLSLTGDLRPLHKLTQLHHLSLTSIKELGWCACEVVGELAQLESLELGECTFRAEFGLVLARLRRLRRLRLERGTAQCAAPALLRALAPLPLLTRLELVNIDVKVGFDDALAECKNIQRLLIIPTYVSQSATTNKQVLSGVLRLKDSLTHLMWGVTIELLRVTELFIDQCDQSGDSKKKDIGECIPVLKPVPGCKLPDEHHHVAGPPQVEILPLPTLQRLLAAQLPNTKLKLLRIPFHATWRQSLADFQ